MYSSQWRFRLFSFLLFSSTLRRLFLFSSIFSHQSSILASIAISFSHIRINSLKWWAHRMCYAMKWALIDHLFKIGNTLALLLVESNGFRLNVYKTNEHEWYRIDFSLPLIIMHFIPINCINNGAGLISIFGIFSDAYQIIDKKIYAHFSVFCIFCIFFFVPKFYQL